MSDYPPRFFKRWSAEDNAFLFEHASKLPLKELASHLERTPSAVESQCLKLGIARDNDWTESEDEYLRAFYKKRTHAEMAKFLGNRTMQGVRNRCYKLRLTKTNAWTEEELGRLRQIYADHAGSPLEMDKICKDFGRDKFDVSSKAGELGLTDRCRPKTPEMAAACGERSKKWIAENGHPRGMAGKSHSDETKKTIGASMAAVWADPASVFHQTETKNKRRASALRAAAKRPAENCYSRAKRGRRADLGDTFFRSSWEANYARYLNWLIYHKKIASWGFETETFWFHKIRRGVTSYKPDFRVVLLDGSHEWHEVKGWMDPKSKTKLKRMSKYYPNEKVVVRGEAWFLDAERGTGFAALIPHWEWWRQPKR